MIYVYIIYTYQHYSNILPIPKKDHWNGELPYLYTVLSFGGLKTTNHLWASMDHLLVPPYPSLGTWFSCWI